MKKIVPNLEKAEYAYEQFMRALGLDLENPNAKDTPKRVVKSMVNDLMKGLYNEAPKITVFPNEEKFDQMIAQCNISVKSLCSHHHLSFLGSATVAYIPSPDGTIIGLSKLNRVVEHFSRRPQVQENLTQQIHDHLNEILKKNQGVAVYIQAKHQCVSLRGVGDPNSIMRTAKLSGEFITDGPTRDEFYRLVEMK